MRYEGSVYRPPSEARSLIIQLTIGCARNRCTFCSMYKEKHFRIRPLEEVIGDLIECRHYYGDSIRRIFLADGDALIVKTDKLLYLLEVIYRLFPYLERVSAYAAPKDLCIKTEEELKALHEAGLTMVYVGAESGDDRVLKAVCKGASSEEIIAGCLKAQAAGMTTSLTLIQGLGGREGSDAHAVLSAELINRIRPDYAALLTLMLRQGTPLAEDAADGRFSLLTPEEGLLETKVFLQHIDSPGTVFRCNHASNYVPLGGNFNADIPRMLEQIDRALELHLLKPEKYRGF